jgi:dynein heavy chain
LKLFDNCAALIFGRAEEFVCGMRSSENEEYEMRTHVPTDVPVEVWMLGTETEMRTTLCAVMKEAVFYYPSMLRTEWLQKQLGMVALAGSQIWWTWEVEESFRKVRQGNKRGMKELSIKLTMELTQLITVVRGQLAKNERKKLNAQIIIDVHQRDIIDNFVRDSVLDEKEFAWESQLRFYWFKKDDDIQIRQCTGCFGFGYEYMGLNGRLVITPLTDRCYMTLTQALHFRLGGSPAGPAGTGKTETVKDLAKSMGCFCVVFNCGEGLDYQAMGRIFSGLAQCGAWGCFDEFNRIDAEVLSVVSTQIKIIQNAMLSGLLRFVFEGKEIALDSRMGIFVTMNPGYAGRTELPDNLKALFRPVTMVIPDLEQICEIMLFSEGFETAKVLAKKMTVLYRLSRDQLSKQHHYDFGLRALKAVLVMAGDLKRGYAELSEEIILMRALRDMNLPKFVYEDVPLFLGLISDLFPGLSCPRVRYPTLNDAVEAALADDGLKPWPKQVVRAILSLAGHRTPSLFPACLGLPLLTRVTGAGGQGDSAVRNHVDAPHYHDRRPNRWWQNHCTSGAR